MVITSAAPQELAEAFSRHQFDITEPYLADTVRWDMVGNEVREGRAQVLATCQQSARYLATVRTHFLRCRVLTGEQHVVVDSVAEYTDAHDNVSKVASCDIYTFADGLITDITSYAVELPTR